MPGLVVRRTPYSLTPTPFQSEPSRSQTRPERRRLCQLLCCVASISLPTLPASMEIFLQARPPLIKAFPRSRDLYPHPSSPVQSSTVCAALHFTFHSGTSTTRPSPSVSPNLVTISLRSGVRAHGIPLCLLLSATQVDTLKKKTLLLLPITQELSSPKATLARRLHL